jgi:hypothetical protein
LLALIVLMGVFLTFPTGRWISVGARRVFPFPSLREAGLFFIQCPGALIHKTHLLSVLEGRRKTYFKDERINAPGSGGGPKFTAIFQSCAAPG